DKRRRRCESHEGEDGRHDGESLHHRILPKPRLGSERLRLVTQGRTGFRYEDAYALQAQDEGHGLHRAAPAVKGGERDSYPRVHAAACQLKRARAECSPFTPSVNHCQSEEKGTRKRIGSPEEAFTSPSRPRRSTAEGRQITLWAVV